MFLDKFGGGYNALDSPLGGGDAEISEDDEGDDEGEDEGHVASEEGHNEEGLGIGDDLGIDDDHDYCEARDNQFKENVNGGKPDAHAKTVDNLLVVGVIAADVIDTIVHDHLASATDGDDGKGNAGDECEDAVEYEGDMEENEVNNVEDLCMNDEDLCVGDEKGDDYQEGHGSLFIDNVVGGDDDAHE